jgi:hypothetical protein
VATVCALECLDQTMPVTCYKKALKAYYKLHKDLLTLNPNINTSLHVFDHINLSYCMDVKYGGVLIQLQQDLEMKQ